VVAAYHEAALGELVAHVAAAIDDFRSGALDAFEVDRVLFQYSRGAKELWKFCNMTDVEWTAGLLIERPRLTGGSAERLNAEPTLAPSGLAAAGLGEVLEFGYGALEVVCSSLRDYPRE
jgi:hypothetical protein